MEEFTKAKQVQLARNRERLIKEDLVRKGKIVAPVPSEKYRENYDNINWK